MALQTRKWLFATDKSKRFVGAKMCHQAPFHLLYLDSDDNEFPIKCGRQGCDFKYSTAEIELETSVKINPMMP